MGKKIGIHFFRLQKSKYWYKKNHEIFNEKEILDGQWGGVLYFPAQKDFNSIIIFKTNSSQMVTCVRWAYSHVLKTWIGP